MKCFLLLPLPFLFTSCVSNKIKMPEKTDERTSLDAPVPDLAMAKRNNISAEKLGLGHAVYMRKCGECHLHVLPDEIKSSSWHVVVPGMSWNAGIEPHEEAALLSYLSAAAKEAPKKKP